MGLHVGGIRSAVRLGETEAADEFPARHAGQVPELLLLEPKAQIGYMHKDDCTETKLRMPESRAPAPADEAVADRVESRAAVTGQ